MTSKPDSKNRVRHLRTMAGLTQAELASRAGISRTAVTAIEGGRIVPSVDAALSLSKALATTVEELFNRRQPGETTQIWESKPIDESRRWQAEVFGRTVFYPADSTPMMTVLPDPPFGSPGSSEGSSPTETLVMACCDPAAGILASLYSAATGMRLLVLPRSSSQAIDLLRDGLVHLAGVHFSTEDNPQGNEKYIVEKLGAGFQTIRLARWQEGVVTKPSISRHSLRSLIKSKLNWVGRDPGSGARKCLDKLLGDRFRPGIIARDHRSVVDAVRSGWADAGVCVQFVAVEAGLSFFPVHQEAFDVCYPSSLADDRRIKAFLGVVRSAAYRRSLCDLPGYDTGETGDVWDVTS